jgi:replication factor C subunit 3/5
LICNYVSKIIPALQSRCTRFRFSPLKPESVELKLNEIARAENITLDRDAAKAIVKLSEGDMRKVLNILESTSMAHVTKVTIEDVYNSTGRPSPGEIDTCFQSLLSDTMNASFEKIHKMKIARSLTLEDIVRDLHIVVMHSGLPKIHKIYVVMRLGEIEQ